jgi:hypothetical protein
VGQIQQRATDSRRAHARTRRPRNGRQRHPFHGQRVFDNANPIGDADALLTRDGGKQHLWIPNAGHNDIFIIATETYFAKLQSFTAQLP